MVAHKAPMAPLLRLAALLLPAATLAGAAAVQPHLQAEEADGWFGWGSAKNSEDNAKAGGWFGLGATKKKDDGIQVGAKMEITVPYPNGTKAMSWVPCTIVAVDHNHKKQFSVMLDMAPEGTPWMHAIPLGALRPRLPEAAIALRASGKRGKAQESVRQKVQAGLSRGIAKALKAGEEFNCTAYPHMCSQPFNCEHFRPGEAVEWYYRGMAKVDSNLRHWCNYPKEASGLATCIYENDPVGGAKIRLKALERSEHPKGIQAREASRCFVEGFCMDTEVRRETTKLEASKLCDNRFGREAWSKFGLYNELASDSMQNARYPGSAGFTNRNETRPWTIMSCATGRYHCDVMTCKQTFCVDEYFVKRFGHLQELNALPL
mmetsp:Transcript_69924/g.198177  ORF Transcript_69924/g.198177 Transcript_69924/m.198177 type:complete len:376 (-) Transcript_69924:78-1205(-)